MNIQIRRTRATRLYTEGLFSINGTIAAHTVEDTLTALPPGAYRLRLTKAADRRRIIAILPQEEPRPRGRHTTHRLQAGGTYLSCRRKKGIGLGKPLIPGALQQGRVIYERLFDRLEKSEARHETNTLIISEEGVTSSEPIAYWLQPPTHCCPPSKRNS